MKKVTGKIKQVSLISISSAFSSLLSVVSLTIIANNLRVNEFGLLVTLQASINTLKFVINSQSWQWIPKFITPESKNIQKISIVIQTGVIVDFIFSLASSLSFLFLAFSLKNVLNNGLFHSLEANIISSLIILVNLQNTPIGIFNGLEKFEQLSIATITCSVIRFTIITIATLISPTLECILYAILVSDFFCIFIHTIYLCKIFHQSNLKIRIGTIKDCLIFFHEAKKFIVEVSIYSIIKSLVREGDVVILSCVTSPSSTAIYKVAKSYASIIFLLTSPLSQVFYPVLIRFRIRNMHREIIKYTIYSYISNTAITLLVISLVYFVPKNLFVYFLNTEYDGLPDIFFSYIIGVLLQFIGFLNTPILMAYSMMNKMIITTLVSSLVYFLLLINININEGAIEAANAYIFFSMCWLLISSYFSITVIKKYL